MRNNLIDYDKTIILIIMPSYKFHIKRVEKRPPTLPVRSGHAASAHDGVRGRV